MGQMGVRIKNVENHCCKHWYKVECCVGSVEKCVESYKDQETVETYEMTN